MQKTHFSYIFIDLRLVVVCTYEALKVRFWTAEPFPPAKCAVFGTRPRQRTEK